MKMLLVKFCLVAEITEGGRERERKEAFLCFVFGFWELMLHFLFSFFAWLSFVWFCGKTEVGKSRKFDEDVVG